MISRVSGINRLAKSLLVIGKEWGGVNKGQKGGWVIMPVDYAGVVATSVCDGSDITL